MEKAALLATEKKDIIENEEIKLKEMKEIIAIYDDKSYLENEDFIKLTNLQDEYEIEFNELSEIQDMFIHLVKAALDKAMKISEKLAECEVKYNNNIKNLRKLFLSITRIEEW
ncbi:hypothetical protein [Spiroplasma tabanidicola]|uniref:Uncharacterized protein n=1 Tax=Spiroplasma tabanidicola TaxID=324079 RepID=A0A6I6C667_9MOLU|nr:hypothetical protein [Spiroplasma tabanidicola]QGS52427.1 hypothetical protein STABA_v1c10800 [Spiroplasma tabanidicola]